MALTEKIIPLASYGQFLGNAHEEHLAAVYEQIELAVIAPTLAMTLTGVPFNTDTLEQLAAPRRLRRYERRRLAAPRASLMAGSMPTSTRWALPLAASRAASPPCRPSTAGSAGPSKPRLAAC